MSLPTGEFLQPISPIKSTLCWHYCQRQSPAYDSAIRIAQQHDLCLDNHQSRRLTSELCKEADLILVMENDHIDRIHQQFPETRGKVMLFGQWLNKTEIPDPHKRSDEMFEHVYQLMEKAVIQWQGKI